MDKSTNNCKTINLLHMWLLNSECLSFCEDNVYRYMNKNYMFTYSSDHLLSNTPLDRLDDKSFLFPGFVSRMPRTKRNQHYSYFVPFV